MTINPIAAAVYNSGSTEPAVSPSRLSNQRDARLKRIIDIAGSGLALILLSPALLLIALAIVASEGFPVIYRRRVVGPKGEFDAFKFRTMRPDADAQLLNDERLRREFVVNFKLKSDPRVTALGSWLRRYSLDELPQLFNVLRGQMSLVGPRMITAPELDKYGKYGSLLLSVKPGITGYWQINGRQDVSYAERVQMDVRYITRRSWKMDLAILLATPLRVLRGKGAY